MGKEVRGVPEAAALNPAASIGRYLAGQRRLRGISLDELAQRSKIPLRSLERLEAGAFDAAADGFARSFVRAVADSLGLDPDDAVARLLSEPGDPDDEAARPGRRVAPPAIAAATLAVALVALGLALWTFLADEPDPDEGTVASEVVIRRDVVRALAESQGGEPGP